jgi:DNA-directed RNA polymerase specialized sigma24 family protein
MVMEFADETPVRRLEVVRARRASSTDLGHLYERRAEAFAGVAASICGEAAPDAVHDAFVRALARVRTLRSRGALEDWVWRSVLNEARRHRTGTPEADAPQTTRASSTGEVDPRGSVVRAAVAALPPRQREAAQPDSLHTRD